MFMHPSLNILLDAGVIVDNSRPLNVFITHGHNDHAMLTPAYTTKLNPPDIYCPKELAGLMDVYIMSNRMLNRGGGFESLADVLGRKVTVAAENGVVDRGDGSDEDEDTEKDGGLNIKDGSAQHSTMAPSYFIKSVTPGESYNLRTSPTTTVTVIKCNHNVTWYVWGTKRPLHKLIHSTFS